MRLLPSLRQKKRYVVFEIISDTSFSFADIQEEVQSALSSFLGQLGIARASPLIVKERFNAQKQRFVIKVNNAHVDELKTALALSKKIKNTAVIIRSITTSGTLKKAGLYLDKE